MKKFKKVLAMLLAGAMVLGFAGCGSDEKETDSADKNVIVFGTNAEFPPFEYVTSKGTIGEFDGIDIAIAQKIAEDQGKEAKINNMEFDSLLLALDNGQVDAVIAGMTVTDERKQAYDFSTPIKELVISSNCLRRFV